MGGKKIQNLKLEFILKNTQTFYSLIEDGKITRMSENLQLSECFLPFPHLSSELDFKHGNISVPDLLKVPISDQQKGCSGVRLLWAKDNFKKHSFYLERAGWEAGATGMDHWKLSLHRERDLPGKCVRKIPSEQMCFGFAESLSGIEGTFPTRAGQPKPAHPFPDPAPSFSSGAGHE